MTQEQHPITPPPELFAEWLAQAKRLHPGESTGFIAGEVARLAYQAGADMELEACCEKLRFLGFTHAQGVLREIRRPKPPSLKEQAFQCLKNIDDACESEGFSRSEDTDIIRRALEALPD